jgi:hypothetical protein
MAAIMGITGSISATGDNVMLLTKAWSFDWTREIHDASTFAGGEYDVTLPGLHGLSGRAEGWLDDTTAISLASFKTDGLTFVLTASSGRTYTFAGIFSNFSPTSELNAVNSWSASFESTGAITVA